MDRNAKKLTSAARSTAHESNLFLHKSAQLRPNFQAGGTNPADSMSHGRRWKESNQRNGSRIVFRWIKQKKHIVFWMKIHKRQYKSFSNTLPDTGEQACIPLEFAANLLHAIS